MKEGLEKIADLKIDVVEKKPEFYPEKIADQSLEKTLEVAEKVNQEIRREENFSLVSKQESLDMLMGANTPGYIEYWTKRLTPELDILPEKIRTIIVERKIRSEGFRGEKGEFDRYINRRVNVLKFNIAKRQEMNTLKKRLGAIDRKEDYSTSEQGGRRAVFYDESSKELFIESEGKRQYIKIGDIVSDYDWGIFYKPDASVPEKLWRRVRKLSDLTEARRKIEDIFNHEISQIERIPLPTTSYSEEHIERLWGDLRNYYLVMGSVAEKMARNWLTRIQYNSPDIGLRVEPSNALEDAELKYDFKITIPEKRRGVALEGEELTRKDFVNNKRKIGIQFTAGKGFGKKKQIAEAKTKIQASKYQEIIKKPVDDIILVKLQFGTYLDYFKKWLKTGKPSGGPEQYITREEKITLFKAVTKNFLEIPEEEIEKIAS